MNILETNKTEKERYEDETRCVEDCVDGYHFNSKSKKFDIVCKSCKERRQKRSRKNYKDVRSGSTIHKELRVRKSLNIGLCTEETLLSKETKNHISTESLKKVGEDIRGLLGKVSAGEKEDESKMINLGSKPNIQEFVSQYLIRGYESGLKVAPLRSIGDYRMLRKTIVSAESTLSPEKEAELSSWLESEVCVVVLDTGVLEEELYALQGLLQTRDIYYNNPTLVVTLNWASYLKKIENDTKVKRKDLCRFVGVSRDMYTPELRRKQREEAEDREDREKRKHLKTSEGLSELQQEALRGSVR